MISMTAICYQISFHFDAQRQQHIDVRAQWKGEEVPLSHSAFLLFLYNNETALSKDSLDFAYKLAKYLRKVRVGNEIRHALVEDEDMAWFFLAVHDAKVEVGWEYRDQRLPIQYSDTLPFTIDVTQEKGKLICAMDGRDTWLNNPFAWFLFRDNSNVICFHLGTIVINPPKGVLNFLDLFLDLFRVIYRDKDAMAFVQNVYKPYKTYLNWRIEGDFSQFLPNDEPPIPKLTLYYENDCLSPSLSYLYGKHEVMPDDKEMVLKDPKSKVMHQRSLEMEQLFQSDLMDIFMENSLPFMLQNPGDIAVFLDKVVPMLRSREWEIESHADSFQLLDQALSFEFGLDSNGMDWFSFDQNGQVDGQDMPYLEIARLMVENQGYLKTSKGFVKVDDRSRKELETLVKLGAFQSNKQFKAYEIVPLVSSSAHVTGKSQSSRDFLDRFKSLEGFTHVDPGKGFNGELRDYQHHGVNWINFLYQNQFGGILADDMGLGKTVQTIAFANQVSEEGPVLVVGPTNVLFNWKSEIEKFTTKKTVLVYSGPGREKQLHDIPNYDFVVTSYGIIKNDISLLNQYPFKAIIVDEAQQIKNPGTQISKAMKELQSSFRLAMTGTPIENHIQDLWNIFDFVMPGYLGSHKAFEAGIKDGQRDLIKLRIRPFVLRREKREVLDSLPEKTEIVLSCKMSEEQQRLYDTVMHATKQGVSGSTGKRDRLGILTALLKLRQVCIHPQLLPEIGKSSIPSAKMELIQDKLSQLIDEGHKVVMFSQFTGMLDILEDWVKSESFYFERIDGSVSAKARMAAVERFQDAEKAGVFLISLKAGGVGLNLTAADYVVHTDPWWNPAIEAQATDRVHRMGQKNKVIVYKLITEGTIEEKIQTLQDHKRELLSQIIDVDSGEKAIDFDDIVELLA